LTPKLRKVMGVYLTRARTRLDFAGRDSAAIYRDGIVAYFGYRALKMR